MGAGAGSGSPAAITILDRVLEYEVRLLRKLRHGPHRRDRSRRVARVAYGRAFAPRTAVPRPRRQVVSVGVPMSGGTVPPVGFCKLADPPRQQHDSPIFTGIERRRGVCHFCKKVADPPGRRATSQATSTLSSPSSDVDSLLKYYKGVGFDDVRISCRVKWDPDSRTVVLIFHIQEGLRSRVRGR